jgi:hypothetical protein
VLNQAKQPDILFVLYSCTAVAACCSLCVRALISGGLATFANKQESICAIKRSSTAIEFELSCGHHDGAMANKPDSLRPREAAMATHRCHELTRASTPLPAWHWHKKARQLGVWLAGDRQLHVAGPPGWLKRQVMFQAAITCRAVSPGFAWLVGWTGGGLVCSRVLVWSGRSGVRGNKPWSVRCGVSLICPTCAFHQPVNGFSFLRGGVSSQPSDQNNVLPANETSSNSCTAPTHQPDQPTNSTKAPTHKHNKHQII